MGQQPCCRPCSSEPGLQHIPQSIAEQIKPQHGEEDGQAGEDTRPRRPGDMPLRGCRQHTAPTGDIGGTPTPRKLSEASRIMAKPT